MALKHLLFSQDQDMTIRWFETFNKEVIKQAIIMHLTDNPKDVIEHCREFSKAELKRFAGYNIIDFYGVNPKNGNISKIFTRGNKEYYLKLN